MTGAAIHEIFASIQGEGLWIGERHIFVRFLGCDIRCRYCDTPAAAQAGPDSSSWDLCRVQTASGENEYEQARNPLSASVLTEFCKRLIIPGPSRPTLSLTGGEPLLHCSFLAEWLPLARNTFKIYLETSGLHAGAMQDLRDLIDVVSMDFKLPSATGLRPFWEEHKQFLRAGLGKTIFAKAVVTKDTTQDDLLTSAFIISELETPIPLVLQPAGGQLTPGPEKLIEFQDTALRIIEDVRVIPQAHKMMNVP